MENWSLGLDARIVLGTFTQLGPAGSGADRGHAEHRAGAGRAARVREVPAAEWDELPGDAYYRRAYVESACVLEPGRPILLEHEGTVFAGMPNGTALKTG